MEEESRSIEISLKDFWSVFKQCWLVVAIAIVVVAIGLYIGLTMTHTDEYTASVKVYILRNSNPAAEGATGGTNVNTSDISIANALIEDFKEIVVTGDNVLIPVLAEMPTLVDTDWKDLKKMVSVSDHADSRILSVSVTTTDAEMSAALAQKITEKARDYVNARYKIEIADIIEAAEVPTQPSNPVSLLMVALIAFVAGIVVYAIYLIAFMMDDKINSEEDVERYLGVSMLGMIPNRYDVSRRKSKYGYYYSHKAPDGVEEKK